MFRRLSHIESSIAGRPTALREPWYCPLCFVRIETMDTDGDMYCDDHGCVHAWSETRLRALKGALEALGAVQP